MAKQENDKHGRRNMDDKIEQHPHQVDSYLVMPSAFTVTSAADAAKMKHPGHGQHANSAQARESLARNPNKSPMGEARQKKHDVNTATAPHTQFEKLKPAATGTSDALKGKKQAVDMPVEDKKGKSARKRRGV